MMKYFKRVTALVMAVMLLSSQLVMAEEATEVPETPSMWALWDVQMAQTYGFGDDSSYMNYTMGVDGESFEAVRKSLEDLVGVADDPNGIGTTLTRRDVIREFYDIIAEALGLEKAKQLSMKEIVEYCVASNILAGRDDSYELESICTKEELLSFATRTYEHIAYSLDEDAKGIYWKVSDEDNTVYLLGSIHASDSSIYPMSKELLAGFEDSEALVVEANILVTSPEDLAYINSIVFLEDGQTIDQLIDKETYEAYAKVMDENDIAPVIYNTLKPWYAANVVSSFALSESDIQGTMGVDLYFMMLSYLRNMPILEVEGIRYQLDMFDSFSPELQEEYLAGALFSEESNTDSVVEMLEAWKAGDLEGFEKLLETQEAQSDVDKEFNEKLFDLRNGYMIEYAKSLLVNDHENDYFYIVGAGHMVGEDGIVQGLRDLGYEVEQIK